MSHTYKLQIKEFHLDTFGHVNNATYLSLFEEARWDLISENGYGLKEVQVKKEGPVILDVHCKFLKELKCREWVSIQTEMLEYPSKIGKLKQSIMNEKNEKACEAIFTFGLFDLKLRKLIPPTDEWKKAIGWEK